uniref:Uncharacterized protein n=1 Tax=Romanomermis culicivorax TaxID=13658 RepID=A0A915JYX7_ROMCU
MGVTCQPLQQSPWYSLCPTTITGVQSGQTVKTGILPSDEGRGPKAQAPACSQQALGNLLRVLFKVIRFGVRVSLTTITIDVDCKIIHSSRYTAMTKYITHRKVDIKISDRKIPNTFSKYLLSALNPALTQET